MCFQETYIHIISHPALLSYQLTAQPGCHPQQHLWDVGWSSSGRLQQMSPAIFEFPGWWRPIAADEMPLLSRCRSGIRVLWFVSPAIFQENVFQRWQWVEQLFWTLLGPKGSSLSFHVLIWYLLICASCFVFFSRWDINSHPDPHPLILDDMPEPYLSPKSSGWSSFSP